MKCGGCGVAIADDHQEYCLCLKPLCGSCWDAFGTCPRCKKRGRPVGLYSNPDPGPGAGVCRFREGPLDGTECPYSGDQFEKTMVDDWIVMISEDGDSLLATAYPRRNPLSSRHDYVLLDRSEQDGRVVHTFTYLDDE